MAKNQKTAAEQAPAAQPTMLDQLRDDPDTLAVAFIKPSGSGKSKIATSRDILVKEGADLNNSQLFMVVTNGMVILKKAKPQGARQL